MGRSLSVPAARSADAESAAEFAHSPSGAAVRISWQDQSMLQSIREQGLSASYPVAYRIGAGLVGSSYLVKLGEMLVQSPVAFYAKTREWGLSPGYERERVLDFSRPVTSDCLFCHAGSVRQRTVLEPIGCERCHGPVEQHLQSPLPGSIVNPAKLSGAERDSVCEQCHLEGAATVLNPGKTWWDFHAGQRLEEVETSYVYRAAGADGSGIRAVSQAEQLRQSLCLRRSGGKLSCATCHDPHGGAVERKAQAIAACRTCHAASQLKPGHPGNSSDCVSCHMPRRNASDVLHAAITDHRIQARPVKEGGMAPDRDIVEWRSAEEPYRARGLGLALFHVARQEHGSRQYQKAWSVLATVAESERDPEVEGALGYMLLASGQAGAAVTHLKRSAQGDKENAERWLDLGVAEQASGDLALAETDFRKSMGEAPYDYRSYVALAFLYRDQKREAAAREVLVKYLELNPQSIQVRLLLR